MKNYTIGVEHDLKIIRYTHIGSIQMEEIGAAWAELLAIKEFTEQGYQLLSDYRSASFSMEMEVVKLIVAYFEPIKHIVKGKKQCLILEDSYSTAGAMLFEKMVNERIGFIVKVFSTEDAALGWLLL